MKSTAMRKTNFFFAVFSLFLLVPASITRAQTISSQKGLTTAVFTTPQGVIKVYLPDDIRPGDQISGTVIAEPNGNNARETKRNLVELVKYTVSIDGNKYTVGAKPETFKWLVHQDRQVTASLELLHVTGVKAHELKMQLGQVENNTPASSGCVIPSHALTDAPCRITGNFDGDMTNTKCSLNGKPMEALVESPRQCQVQYPQYANGLQTMQVNENGQEKCTRQISGVDMQVTTGDLDLRKGQNTYIDVKLTGLQNLPDTALLTITNVTPNIVTMTNGNLQVFAIMFTDSEGVWEVHCPAVSLTTGNFQVTINLDLPKVQADYPPTQPQPQPQPGDTTVAQCPRCNCSCSDAKIIFEGIEGDVATYRVEVKAACTGQFGPPPCKGCAIIDAFKYEWHYVTGAGKPVDWAGDHNGPGVKIKNPGKDDFLIAVLITVTCNDGSKCYCAASATYHPPTTTEQPKCKCHGDCSILLAEKRKGEISYWCKVNAECTGKDCYVYDVKYRWSVVPADVAEIDGINYAPSVTIKLKKAGSYNVHLNGKVICSDGSECDYNCSLEETYDPNFPTEEFCNREIKEMTEPAMVGGLKFNTNFPAKRKILRDDPFALGAEGIDYDMLKIICKPTNTGCTQSDILVPLAGRVGFKWTITNGKGRFVKLGCLFNKNGNDQQDEGEHVIFMPPFVPLPVGDAKEATEITKITLLIIDEKKDGMNDGQLNLDFEIKTTRSTDNLDLYTVEIIYPDKYKYKKLPDAPVETKPEGSCEAKHGPWVKEPDKLTKPVISLPNVQDKDKMVLGQWIVLEANDQHEKDLLKDIVCSPTAKCKTELPEDRSYEDNVQWEWTRIGDGRLVSGPIGRYVIYEAPAKMPEGVQQLEVKFKVKVYNPDIVQATDDAMWSDEITINIYQPGIQMQYPPDTWLPAESKSAAPLPSELKYLKDGRWEPALAHMCRIHFFELLNVSEEKGVCMNDPVKDKANQCSDLQFNNNEPGHEAYEPRKADNAKCTLTDQWQKARTEKPEKEHTINVHSLDYGSYGFILSKAQLSQNTVGDFLAAYDYFSIPWTNETVKHHREGQNKAKKYPDNRVSIPYDIDENHIPDIGWITNMPDPGPAIADRDATPIAIDGFLGDGLTNYEEYRGFKTRQKKTLTTEIEGAEGKEDVHVRTNPQIKTVFIHNPNDLPIDKFRTATNLEVFEISEPQYVSKNIRVVNFNFNPLSHVVDQMGLYLFDGKRNGKYMGKAFSTDDNPGRPNDERGIAVYMDRITEIVNSINKEIADENARREKIKAGTGTLKPLDKPDKVATVVAHELCHGLNVCHHGEGDEAKEYDLQTRDPLRSGDLSCVMRYDNHNKEGTGWYPGYHPETPGNTLCTSPAGTGYNANNRANRDADPGRGNCTGQIRVSGVGPRPPPCIHR